MIVGDPKLGIREGNIIHHNGLGNPCKHLKQISEFKYKCAIHKYKWYKKTPCYQHGQIERSKNDLCRMGEFVLKKNENKKAVI